MEYRVREDNFELGGKIQIRQLLPRPPAVRTRLRQEKPDFQARFPVSQQR